MVTNYQRNVYELGKKVICAMETSPTTYPTKESYWDNWFPYAFALFYKLANKGLRPQSFADIGTGAGTVAMGAAGIFDGINSIDLTDVGSEDLELAERNLRKFYDGNINIRIGHLTQPLENCVDIAFLNLPIIPTNEKVSGKDAWSFYTINDKMIFPDYVKKYFLQSYCEAIHDAKGKISKEGMIIMEIGGRFPYHHLESIVNEAGLEIVDSVAGFKRQTEPWDVLQDFAWAERNLRVEFDFYRHGDAIGYLATINPNYPNLPDLNLKGSELKKKHRLGKFRVSARHALEIYQLDAKYKVPDVEMHIGHVVHVIALKKKL